MRTAKTSVVYSNNHSKNNKVLSSPSVCWLLFCCHILHASCCPIANPWTPCALQNKIQVYSHCTITTLLAQGTAINKSLPEIGKLLQMWLCLLAHTPSNVAWFHTPRVDNSLALATVVCLGLSPHHKSPAGLTGCWMAAVWLVWISPTALHQMTRHRTFLRIFHRNTQLPSIWLELLHARWACSSERNKGYD